MRFHGLVIVFALAACSRESSGPSPSSSGSTSTGTAPPPPQASSPTIPAAPPKAAASGAASAAYAGTYSLAPRAYYISDAKDWSSVKQVKDDPAKHVGDGTVTLSVGDDGRVTGAIEGPAGPAVVDGSVVDGEIRANVRRKEASDEGLTGTLVASPKDGSGKLSLAESNAAIVREGKIALKKN